jgi:DNA-binding transcriptional ArsR family regulator
MNDVFKALADPSRRALLDSLNEQNGQSLRQLCVQLSMTRQSVSRHLAVLEGAELVSTRRRGRDKLHFLDAEPIRAIADGWIKRYEHAPATSQP